MVITYPRNDIMEIGRFVSQSFLLQARQEYSRAAETYHGKDLGDAIWVGDWTTRAEFFDDILTFEAALNSLDGVVSTFYAGDQRRIYPKAYPDGVFSDSGTISAVHADNDAITLKTLPAGFIISVGDYFHFDYSSGKRALHRFLEAGVANGSGVTGSLQVRPHIKPGAVADIEVVFKKPRGLFRLEPGSVQQNMPQTIISSVSFRAVQV